METWAISTTSAGSSRASTPCSWSMWSARPNPLKDSTPSRRCGSMASSGSSTCRCTKPARRPGCRTSAARLASKKRSAAPAFRCRSGIPFTILRPSNFHQNDYWFKDVILQHGVYPQPFGTAGVARVDVRDIAEAAAIALTTSDHEGESYDLVGPANVTAPWTAEIWSKVLGKTINYGGDDLDAWEKVSLQYMPKPVVFDFKEMYRFFETEGLTATSEDVARVTKLLGHPPRSFETLRKRRRRPGRPRRVEAASFHLLRYARAPARACLSLLRGCDQPRANHAAGAALPDRVAVADGDARRRRDPIQAAPLRNIVQLLTRITGVEAASRIRGRAGARPVSPLDSPTHLHGTGRTDAHRGSGRLRAAISSVRRNRRAGRCG